ncbi:minor structural GP20 protein [[Clostridium] sordellii]|uniref:phage scaffolding protein n=1 Tax=Paraclostridium sordellii TaxID=1505 RepID=UPI0005E64C02|nr:phage scaffolding protein [Paeniclostridium sordellii]CEQ09745.1 minor structural GP20 protein [[Clostridium] sordellii] [Paeniclostridium sordellii]
MKLAEILKNQGLSDEQINKIIADMKENKVYTTYIENVDEKYSKLETEKNNLKGQLDTANTTIKDLKKDNKDNETLQNTIKEHEKTIENLKKDNAGKIKRLTLDNAISSKLSKVDDKYKKLLESQFDREKMTINEDGTITGLDEQYKTISETYSEWFGDKIPNNTGSLGNFAKNTNGNMDSLGERLAKQATESNQFNKHNYFGGDK